MGISFSSSLFGLAGSLILGFLDLQTARRRTGSTPSWRTGSPPRCATRRRGRGGAGAGGRADIYAAIERLSQVIAEGGSNKPATAAMANLAEAIQGLVHHMRSEQQLIREWVDGQAGQHREIKRLLEIDGARPGASRVASGRKKNGTELMALARGRRERGIDYWPGFVDALSTLVLGIIFLLTVFVVVQFFLSQEVAGKDTALTRLNAQIAQLTDLLSLEKTGKVDLEDEIARLRAGLSGAENERDRCEGTERGQRRRCSAAAQGKISELSARSRARRA